MEGNWFVGRGGEGEVRRKGQQLSNHEFWFGDIMNLISCQTSADDWLVVGYTGLKFSTSTWTDGVDFG